MSQSYEFDRLEQFVQKLLTEYEQMLDKNTHLQRLLQQRENEILELKEKINSADSERGDISGRIKHLIDQIEEWQSAVVEPHENEPGENAAPEEEESAVSEESAEKKGEEETRQDREAGPQRNQRNLFQVGPDQQS